MRVERIGRATLYLADCLEVPDLLEPAGALVSDPPYGIKFGHSRSRKNRVSSLAWGEGSESQDRGWSDVEGDDEPFNPSPWLQHPQIVLFGANHFASRLPESPSWRVWDKRDGTASDNHSDCELIWTNLGGPARIWRQLWRGVVRAGEDNAANSPKHHPCQKPIELMRWLVSQTEGVVKDPYMGSGTTGVAAVEAGREFVGAEIDPVHFQTSCERIERAQRQERLFA
jgi:site-specific DNA-methyltransferase (adenine-specific)